MKCQLSITREKLNKFKGKNYQGFDLLNLMDIWFGPSFYDQETDIIYWQFDDCNLILAQIILKDSYRYLIDNFNLCSEDDEVIKI